MQRATSVLAALLLAASAACGPPARPGPTILGGIRIEVQAKPAKLTFLDAKGNVLLEGLPGAAEGTQSPPESAMAFTTARASYDMLEGSFKIQEKADGWHGVTAFANVKTSKTEVSFDLVGPPSGGHATIRSTADHVLELSVDSPGMNRTSVGFTCASDEHFLGFGAQSFDVDHRGHTVPVWVSEQGIGKRTDDTYDDQWFVRGTRHSSYFAVPFVVSSRSYGLLADTARRTIFALCSESQNAWRVEAWTGKLSFHLFFGSSPMDVLKKHSGLVGRPPMPPAFAFAPWNDAIFGSANVRRVAKELRDNAIPSSVIWTEDWGGGHDTSATSYALDQNWKVDRTLYPDVETLASDLHTQGFKFLAYFNTFVAQGDDHYDDAVANDALITQPDGTPYLFTGVTFRPTSMVDLTSPAANDWMAGYLNGALDLGFDGWMADYGEWLPADAVMADGEDALDVHDRYPVLWQQLNDRVLGARSDGVDRLVFVRSGYTGSQAVGHQVIWGGDQTTDFDPTDGLPTVVPIGLGLGVVGMPFYGSDIGGYFSAPGGESTKELFFRWTELGAFSPIMRTHHGRDARGNWAFDSDAETLAHFKRYATLHIRLYPYLEAAALTATTTGAPIFRALGLAYPGDDTAWAQTEEYLLGPDLLVAPVVTQGATDRQVYLPKGTWLPLSGGAPVTGPTSVDVPAPLDSIPVFARAGAVIVLLPDGVETLAPAGPGVTTLADAGADRELWVYLGANGSADQGGVTATLTSSGAPASGATLSLGGTALPACDPTTPAPPCGDVDAANRTAIARVTGPGTLSLGDATLAITGGPADRTLTARLFW